MLFGNNYLILLDDLDSQYHSIFKLNILDIRKKDFIQKTFSGRLLGMVYLQHFS